MLKFKAPPQQRTPLFPVDIEDNVEDMDRSNGQEIRDNRSVLAAAFGQDIDDDNEDDGKKRSDKLSPFQFGEVIDVSYNSNGNGSDFDCKKRPRRPSRPVPVPVERTEDPLSDALFSFEGDLDRNGLLGTASHSRNRLVKTNDSMSARVQGNNTESSNADHSNDINHHENNDNDVHQSNDVSMHTSIADNGDRGSILSFEPDENEELEAARAALADAAAAAKERRFARDAENASSVNSSWSNVSSFNLYNMNINGNINPLTHVSKLTAVAADATARFVSSASSLMINAASVVASVPSSSSSSSSLSGNKKQNQQKSRRTLSSSPPNHTHAHSRNKEESTNGLDSANRPSQDVIRSERSHSFSLSQTGDALRDHGPEIFCDASRFEEQSKLPPMKGRMQVTIVQVHSNCKLKGPYVQLSLEDQVFYTTVSKKDPHVWNESFEFKVSFHSQLFSSLQFDLFEGGSLFGKNIHVGRSEFRLSLLETLPEEFSSWFEIWPKSASISNISPLFQKQMVSANVAALQVNIRYTYQHHQLQPSSCASFPITNDDIQVNSPMQEAMRAQIEDAFNHHSKEVDQIAEGLNAQKGHDMDDLENKNQSSEAGVEAGMNLDHKKEIAQFELEEYDAEDASDIEPATTFLENIGGVFVGKETVAVMRGVRRMLAVFGQGIDIGNAGLMSGLFMLERFYSATIRHKTNNIVSDLDTICTAKHFLRFSLAAYGWKGLSYFGKTDGIIRDLATATDKKAVLKFLEIPDSKMLKFYLHSDRIFQPSYFIVHDESTNSIVLSIRGTMNISDVLTDLVCEYAPWKGGLVHSGILSAATWFYDHLTQDLVEFVNKYNASQLILTGHSLGAGSACLYTILLCEEARAKFPSNLEIRCHAFASPAILSKDLGSKYVNIISSYVYQDDMVCRLSYGSLMDLRRMIVCAVEQVDINMEEIFRIFYLRPDNPDSKRRKLENLKKCRDEIIFHEDTRLANLKLFPPGQIYYLYKKPLPTDSSHTIMELGSLDNVNEIIVSSNMFLNHLPNHYDRAFERTAAAMRNEEVRRLNALHLREEVTATR